MTVLQGLNRGLMRLIKYILLILLIPSCGMTADKWTTEDTLMQMTVTSLLIADCLQTVEVATNDDNWETNPLLGKEPNTSDVYGYFAAAIAGGWIMAYIVPKEWRTVVQSFMIGWEGNMVVHNYNLGIRINF